MLIEFSIGNYRSFKEIVTFSMVAAKINAKDKKLNESNVFRINENLSLLKSAAIYGANASGKSNFAQAINFMKYFVLSSSKETQAKEAIGVEEFRLNTETVKQPSFFQIVFLLEGKRYRYGFEVDKQHVVSEWLFYVPNKREAKGKAKIVPLGSIFPPIPRLKAPELRFSFKNWLKRLQV